MKKKLIVLIILISCNQKKFNLNGKWEVTNVDLKVKNKNLYTKKMKERYRNKYNKETALDYYMYNQILKLEEGSIYNFKSNDSIKITFSNDSIRELLHQNKTVETNYKLSEDNKNLSIGNHKYIVKIHSLEKITIKKALLSNNLDTLCVTLFNDQNYEKLND